jgi:DNA-binding MarR family transcriptional regulator
MSSAKAHQTRCIVTHMNGLELFLLGRTLMKLGEEVIPPSGLDQMAPSVRTVLVDVFSNPGSSVSEITERTGFPQSHVSASVAKLRDLGAMVTEPDPADRRRTLVSPAPGMMQKAVRHSSPPIDETIAAALGPEGQEHLDEVLAALEMLGRVVTPGVHRDVRSALAEAP